MTTESDITTRIEAAQRWAKDAGALALEFFRQIVGEVGKDETGIEISRKGSDPNDIFTAADTASEKLLGSLIRDEFPNDGIVGEEGTGDTASNSGFTWVLDPIDGTVNFSKGIDIWAISIGLCIDNESVAGVVVDPNRDEVFVGQRGKQSTLNGRPISVSIEDDLANAMVAYVAGASAAGQERLARFIAMSAEKLGTPRSLGCAVLDRCWVACGRFDVAVLHENRWWDFAAAHPIIVGAGGFSGTIESDSPSESLNLCSNARLQDELRQLVRDSGVFNEPTSMLGH